MYPKKFRAWYKKERRFVYFELIPGGWCFEEDEIDFKKLGPWEQFTGLKDSRGVEIYDNDILVYNDWKPKNRLYEERRMIVDNFTEIVGWDADVGSFCTPSSSLLWRQIAELSVVIGNAYQNGRTYKSIKKRL